MSSSVAITFDESAGAVNVTFLDDGGAVAVEFVEYVPAGGAGSGDMAKAVYDTDADGSVDSAEAVPWSGVTGKPSTFAPSSHAGAHQHGGGDEIATATPAANAIPKAGASGRLAMGFLASGTPDGTKFVRDDDALAAPVGGLPDPGVNGLVVRTGAGTTTARSLIAGSGIAVSNGDGAAGNPAAALDIAGLTVDAASVFVPGASDAFPTYDLSAAANRRVALSELAPGLFRRDVHILVEEWPSGQATHAWRDALIGTGATTTPALALVPDAHFTALEIRTGTTAASGRSLKPVISSTQAAAPLNGNRLWELQWIFSLSLALADTRFRLGLGVEEVVEGANGIWLRYDTHSAYADATFKFVCRASSTNTTVDSGVAPALDQWYRLRIRNNGAGMIYFSLDGAAEQSVGGVPTVSLCPQLVHTNNAGGVDQRSRHDWCAWAFYNMQR